MTTLLGDSNCFPVDEFEQLESEVKDKAEIFLAEKLKGFPSSHSDKYVRKFVESRESEFERFVRLNAARLKESNLKLGLVLVEEVQKEDTFDSIDQFKDQVKTKLRSELKSVDRADFVQFWSELKLRIDFKRIEGAIEKKKMFKRAQEFEKRFLAEKEAREKNECKLKESQEALLKIKKELELKEAQEAPLKLQKDRELKATQEALLQMKKERDLKDAQEALFKNKQERQLKEAQEALLKIKQEREMDQLLDASKKILTNRNTPPSTASVDTKG